MTDKNRKNPFGNLPDCAADYIRLVIKKMRWRRKVRADVQAELIAHFEDALKNCKTDEEKEKTAKELTGNFGNAKMLGVLARRAKKRCRPLWRKVLIHSLQALGVIILYITICAVYIATGIDSDKLNTPVNYVEWLNDYVCNGRDESLNCTPMIKKATDIAVPMPKWLEDSNATWPGDFNEIQSKEFENWLAQNTQAFETLKKAFDKPYYWSIYDTNEFDLMKADFYSPLSKYRNLAKAMNWQIRYQAYKNNTEEAVNNTIKLCSFGQKMQGNGMLIEQLVGIAIEAITHSTVFAMLDRTALTTEQLEKLQNFARQHYNDTIIDISAEKAFQYDFIQRNFTDDGKGGGRPVREGITFAGRTLQEMVLNALIFKLPDKREVIAQTDKLYDDLQQSFEDNNYRTRNEQYEDIFKNAPMAIQVFLPAVGKIAEISWRLKTDRDGLITTLAVLRYHKETNSYPESLDELLNKGYIKQIPFDAYRAGSLTYRKTGDSFLLYSFGSDFDDDGGKTGADKKGRPQKWNTKDGDAVFWPVPHPAK